MRLKNVIKTILLVVFLFQKGLGQQAKQSFKAEQLKYARVKAAYDSKWPALQNELKLAKINSEDFDIYLRVFKHEKEIQVWMKNKTETSYKLFKTYDVCASSGSLGPKRKEGDGQVPEGFYKIDLFNPSSNYHLSLRVSYPNTSDGILKTGKNAGGAIMVHGNCVTIGCLPITDDKIKELYVLCVEAQNRKRTIPIDIFPIKLTDANIKTLQASYPKSSIEFWNTLKPAYAFFETHKYPTKVKTAKNGSYTYN